MNTKYYQADDDISTNSNHFKGKSGKSPIKSGKAKESKLPSRPVKPVFESSEERILFHRVLLGGNVLDNVSIYNKSFVVIVSLFTFPGLHL